MEPSGSSLEDTRVSVLTRERAVAEWDVLAPFFEQAIPYTCGRRDIDDVRDCVDDGNGLVIIAWNPDASEIYATFLAECLQYPKKRVMSLTLCGGGSIALWKHLYPAIVHVAESMGFDQLEVVGRPGWSKIVGADKETNRMFVEELNGGK